MQTHENHLRSLDLQSSYPRWFAGQVQDSNKPRSFFYDNVLDSVRYLLGQIPYQDDLVYAPPCEFNLNGERIHAGMPARTGGGTFKYSTLTFFTVTLAD